MTRPFTELSLSIVLSSEALGSGSGEPMIATAIRHVTEGHEIVRRFQPAELAETTVTYGQRLKSARQRAPESVLRDALEAADLGEKADPKAANWTQFRQQLQDLLKKDEPPPEQNDEAALKAITEVYQTGLANLKKIVEAK